MVASAPPSLTTYEMDGTDSTEPAGMATAAKETEDLREVHLYDTTLRDGTQMEGISASVNDKLKIARELHSFGTIHAFDLQYTNYKVAWNVRLSPRF